MSREGEERVPPLDAALEAQLAGLGKAPTRRPWRDLALFAVLSAAYGGGILAWLTMRPDLDALPWSWVAGYAAAWLVSFGVLGWLALVPRRGAVMPRVRHAAIAALVASTLFVVIGALADAPSQRFYEPTMDNHMHYGRICLGAGTLTAVVPVIVGALLLRGALPVGGRLAAAALGAAGGSVGGLVLHFHCPIANGWHLAIAHGGVVAVCAGLAALLVPQRG